MEQAWMREHYDRMLTYSPYFDSRLAWYPNAWVYKDSYAIYPSSDVVDTHPDWVLRDANGEMLFIPYGCSQGRCPQYAGDIGNPEFRRFWIESLKRTLERGYLGVYIDDVNLDWRVGDGYGNHVKPMDPRTGKQMVLSDWRRYFAEFMELVRSELPQIEIVHNSIWHATPIDDPFIERQIKAADYIGLERGATDDGIVAGRGKYGLETFMAFVERVHSFGGQIILDDDDSDSRTERDYELAVYLLVSDGGDLIGADGDRSRMNPDNFWDGYDIRLGAPVGGRYVRTDSLISRDYECGRVLLNQPSRRVRFVKIDPDLRTLEGERVRWIRLNSSSAAILVREECIARQESTDR
jgi:hypothetical protein